MPTAAAQPQNAEMAASEIASVEVSGVRDPGMLPYPKDYELLSALEGASGRRVEARFRITSAKTGQPVPGLQAVFTSLIF